MDSKAVASFAKRKNKNKTRDGRRETDADYGRKEYRGMHKDGTLWEKIVKWFGYKLHLIVDVTYELPVMFSVTKASEPDINEAHRMLMQMEKKQPIVLEVAKTMAADKAYDDTKLITILWDQYNIKPVIDIRNMWKDEDKTRVLEGKANVVYDYKGTVCCVCPETGIQRRMAVGGFEKDRNTLKKLCPAKQYGKRAKDRRSVL